MTQLRRAVVLAHRGEQWTLLQNACRALWNTINTLVTARIGVEGSEEEGERVVYGLACKPLYFAASALTDLLNHSKAAPAPPQVRQWEHSVNETELSHRRNGSQFKHTQAIGCGTFISPPYLLK